jgi:hypothetical protein
MFSQLLITLPVVQVSAVVDRVFVRDAALRRVESNLKKVSKGNSEVWDRCYH